MDAVITTIAYVSDPSHSISLREYHEVLTNYLATFKVFYQNLDERFRALASHDYPTVAHQHLYEHLKGFFAGSSNPWNSIALQETLISNLLASAQNTLLMGGLEQASTTLDRAYELLEFNESVLQGKWNEIYFLECERMDMEMEDAGMC